MHVFAGAFSADRMDSDASPIAPWISSAYGATRALAKNLTPTVFPQFLWTACGLSCVCRFPGAASVFIVSVLKI